MIELAFSILAADFAHLADEIARAERGGGTIVHVDVMDGHFVPNITFGPPGAMQAADREAAKGLKTKVIHEGREGVERVVPVLPKRSRSRKSVAPADVR